MRAKVARKVAIIACDHGLGHVRRCALMARELEEEGKKVTLLAPIESVKKIQHVIPSAADLNVHDFSTQTRPEKIVADHPDVMAWLDRLPSLEAFDEVICDNLPEILGHRPDAVISAQFFWHDILETNDNSYRSYCEKLLEHFKPIVFGNDLFSMDAVRSQPRFQPVGLYRSPELVAASKKITPQDRTDLLVTGGTTPAVKKELSKIIQELVRTGPAPYKKIHVDPELLPNDAPHWLVSADFTIEMYCRLKAAICRPGLGVLTDLLTVGITPTVLFEEGNAEMAHNAAVIRNGSNRWHESDSGSGPGFT